MIFKCVAELDKNEKRFFHEEIDVFIRLIEVFCEKNNVENTEDSSLTPDVYKELIKIGVINKRSDIGQLQKVLKKNYDSFIKAVQFCANNKEDVYDTIWKLYNSEREKVQKKAGHD